MARRWHGRTDDVVVSGTTIRSVRTGLGWSRERVAREAACSVETVERAERGRRTVAGLRPAALRLTTAQAIAGALGIDIRTVTVPAVDGSNSAVTTATTDEF